MITTVAQYCFVSTMGNLLLNSLVIISFILLTPCQFAKHTVHVVKCLNFALISGKRSILSCGSFYWTFHCAVLKHFYSSLTQPVPGVQLVVGSRLKESVEKKAFFPSPPQIPLVLMLASFLFCSPPQTESLEQAGIDLPFKACQAAASPRELYSNTIRTVVTMSDKIYAQSRGTSNVRSQWLIPFSFPLVFLYLLGRIPKWLTFSCQI